MLWLPIVIAILLLVVDSSMLFMSRSHAMRMQDADRLYSVGQFTGEREDSDSQGAKLCAVTTARAVAKCNGDDDRKRRRRADPGDHEIREIARSDFWG